MKVARVLKAGIRSGIAGARFEANPAKAAAAYKVRPTRPAKKDRK